ncbi:2OG-FeII_Oxy domain-containing protein/DIOX_N domain-containing protein [Cephalotus follicularis]|uniref:2OG-FeII_Oxy domain-containing protein/DIOX_N domain-containing protein n=1 Tax=Cephalotus follicularis TaxID=3775 RepID=A0A1Q3BXP3_CEPFO|nr:2OG-FeII_Oxy domain-containing protein/DIOX_N domain-containing protein [Cephalotus follicularis]
MAQEAGLPYVPDCHVKPSSHRPNLAPETANDVPIIDLAMLRQGTDERSSAIKQVANACRHFGFFQIVNHGICRSILDEAITLAIGFFKLPTEEKMKFMSTDVYKPVRYATSLTGEVDGVQLCRAFLKLYSHPLKDYIDDWPNNPPDYREKMGNYCVEVRKVALEIMGAITESLGIGTTYLTTKMEDGIQVMVVNCYPPCPKPDLAVGLAPHSDHSCLTIILQSTPGLEILDTQVGKWRIVPKLDGALQVLVGDHLEVLSNGIYKSVVHKAGLNSDMTRISIASFHSLGMDEQMVTAKELVDDQHPKKYKDSSFRDFLNFLYKTDMTEGARFIHTLKIKE